MNSMPIIPWSDTDPGLLAPEPVTVLNNFFSYRKHWVLEENADVRVTTQEWLF